MRASGYDRNLDDWYVEPAWAIEALLNAERPFVGRIMDPCCGGGNIPLALCKRGHYVIAADVMDRGGCAVDMVGEYNWTIHMGGPDSVISNPPYDQAQEFISCALEHTTDRVCVLLRLAFLEGMKRREWFKTVPLARVWVSSKRMSMPPGGVDVKASGGSIAYAWFVFEHKHVGSPVVGWLQDVTKVVA